MSVVEVRFLERNEKASSERESLFVDSEKSWTSITSDIQQKLNIAEKEEWGFVYVDDEGDCVVGKSELEWTTVQRLAVIKGGMEIEAFPLEDEGWVVSACRTPSPPKPEQDCTPSLSCCPPKNPPSTSCCPPKKTISCCPPKVVDDKSKSCSDAKSSKCCPSEKKDKPFRICETPESNSLYTNSDPQDEPCCKPIPFDFEYDRDNLPEKSVNPHMADYKYTEDALWCVALPLGPVGGGNISIAGDGGLRQWQISNKILHTASVPNSFFAIKVDKKAVVLQSDTWYEHQGVPSKYITDNKVPDCSKALLKALPGIKTVEITAKYPVVEVDYVSDEIPTVKVHLEAWSPKIPQDSRNSGFPALVFDFHVNNPSTADVEVELLSSLQNIAGWNGQSDIGGEGLNAGYGGNVNSLLTSSNFDGIDMSSCSLGAKDHFNGHVATVAMKEPDDVCSYMLQYSTAKELWANFTGAGLPGQGHAGPSQAGFTWNGALSNARTVKAGQSTVFTFVLAWHFPNRYKDWYNIVRNPPNTDIFVGNHYATVWKNINQVIDDLSTNMVTLRDKTYKFRDSMFNSTLPWQLIDSVAGRISILNSPTCLWLADGYFYGFEGCSYSSGCCPLNCTHVWNYEQALACLYPDLERSMREIDLLHQISPEGVIPSRAPTPLQLQRFWNGWKDYKMPNQASCSICVDGEMGTVLKAYREVRLKAPADWFKKIYGPVKILVNRWLDHYDVDESGMIFGPQPNTFDIVYYGYHVLIGTLYLAGLRAAEEMAKLQEDPIFAQKCRDRFEKGSVNLDKVCFTNGKWYTHVVDPKHPTNVTSTATMTACLYGQWWAHLLDLGYLLPKEHIVSHLKSVYERNYVKSFDPNSQQPRQFCDQRDDGWRICVWDEPPPKNRMYYSTEAQWSGALYPFAGLMMQEGLKDEALHVLLVQRNNQDGTRRSPWNEIECGDHYSRAMSSFCFFQIASGQSWHYTDEEAMCLSFKPRLNEDDFRGFFILGTCWGQFVQKLNSSQSGHAELHVEHGSVVLSEFQLGVEANMVQVMHKGEQQKFSASQLRDSRTALKFKEPIRVEAGQVLSIVFK